MFKLKNELGQIIDLSYNDYFDLIEIQGQTEAAADISSVSSGSSDGDSVTNAKVHPRTLGILIHFKGGVDIEDATRKVFEKVKIKQTITVEWTQNERTVEITGVVESISEPRWQRGIVMQIDLHCSNPYWQSIQPFSEVVGGIRPLHYFTNSPDDMLYFPDGGIPFGEINNARTAVISNTGDTAVEVDVEITATGAVRNPFITNGKGEMFGIGSGSGSKKVDMAAGDILKISTHKGNKSVTLGNTNLIGKLRPHSFFYALKLQTGENTFTVDADSGAENMEVVFKYRQLYV